MSRPAPEHAARPQAESIGASAPAPQPAAEPDAAVRAIMGRIEQALIDTLALRVPKPDRSNLDTSTRLAYERTAPTHRKSTCWRVSPASALQPAGRSISEGLAPEVKQAIAGGIADAWQQFDGLSKSDITTGKVTSGDLFGTREYLQNNYLYRMAGAVLGIYGNSKEEAMCPMYRVDAAELPLDAAKARYTLHFPPGQLPPVNAFWSLTMYELPSSLLVANPLNRYLINSPMLSGLKKDADGGLTLYVQSESPGADKESNWLPAPRGPFWCVLRLYWPKEAAINGQWKQPPLLRAP